MKNVIAFENSTYVSTYWQWADTVKILLQTTTYVSVVVVVVLISTNVKIHIRVFFGLRHGGFKYYCTLRQLLSITFIGLSILCFEAEEAPYSLLSMSINLPLYRTVFFLNAWALLMSAQSHTGLSIDEAHSPIYALHEQVLTQTHKQTK